MVEILRKLRNLLLGQEVNLTFLPVEKQVDIFLDFLEEGAVLPDKFIEIYLRWAEAQLGIDSLSCQRLIVLVKKMPHPMWNS